MEEKLTNGSAIRELRRYFRKDAHDDGEVDTICNLLRTANLEPKRDGLPLIRRYLKNCAVYSMKVLKQMALSGLFNVSDSLGETPLHWFITEGKFRKSSGYQAIKVIIGSGGNPSLTDLNGDNVLHLAVANKLTIEFITAILEGQPKPSPVVTAKNKQGWTPVRILVSHHEFLNTETLQTLKDYGADINEKDELGNSLLHIVMSRCSANPTSGVTSYRNVQWWASGHIAKTFVELGADVNAKNNSNYVPLRLAIDLGVNLNYIICLIPTKDILNDDSCWDGPFIDYVLKNAAKTECGVFVRAAIEAGANRFSEETLSNIMDQSVLHPKDIEFLLTKLECRVNFEVLNEVINQGRFEILDAILANADDQAIMILKATHPNILVKISQACVDNELLRLPLVNLISLLVNKFDIDVNYKEQQIGGEESMLLHNLVRLHMPEHEDGDISSLEFALSLETLKIDEMSKIRLDDMVMEMSALEFALQIHNYEAAELLIKNFADTSKIVPMSLEVDEEFAHCFQLLSVLGHKFDFEALKETADEKVVQEVDYLENWISERSKNVLSLKELAAMQVRRHASKEEMNKLITNIEIPEDIQGILLLRSLKCDFVAIEEEDESSGPEVFYFGYFAEYDPFYDGEDFIESDDSDGW